MINDTSGILIVEDSHFIRYLLKKNIEQLEMRTVGECSSAAEALKLYQECQPDIVIMDYSLPDQNGTQLVEDLLSLDIYARIILLIPMRMESETQNLIAMGVQGVISKPFYPEPLQKCLIEVVFSQ